MKQDGTIYITSDYGSFKRLEGNRAVSAARAKKIRKSIEVNGYIKSPIAVNENMEVIDGQGRLEALSQLGMPVHYYIVPGAGREQCIAMNIYGTPWNIIDYVKSYKENGVESYKYLDALIETHRSMQLSVILFAIAGKESQNDYIKNGTFQCTREAYLMADRVLEKCERASKSVATIPGNNQFVYKALIFAFTHVELDEERMFMCLERSKGNMRRCGTVKEALDLLSEIYNYKCRANFIYLYAEYDKFQRSKYGWYESRYSQFPATPEH